MDQQPLDLDVDFMWKDANSNVTNCPAMYRTELDGEAGYVLQGKKVSDATRAKLRQLGADEDAVFVPANVVDRIKDGQ